MVSIFGLRAVSDYKSSSSHWIDTLNEFGVAARIVLRDIIVRHATDKKRFSAKDDPATLIAGQGPKGLGGPNCYDPLRGKREQHFSHSAFGPSSNSLVYVPDGAIIDGLSNRSR